MDEFQILVDIKEITIIKLNFNFNSNQIILECKKDEYMKDILKKYRSKIDQDTKDFYFFYNGDIINKELKLKDIYNSINDDEMKILVIDCNDDNNEEIFNNQNI